MRTIRALLIPAAGERPCQVTEIGYTAVAFSDAIGGGLLADVYYGVLCQHTAEPGEIPSARRFCIYADENRLSKRLPSNLRADVLAARLGCIEELRSIPLTGDILITGATPTGDDTNIPCQVLTAAWRGNLLRET